MILLFVQAVVERRLDFEWAVTRIVSDDPAKGLGRAAPEALFHEQLREIIGDPVSDLELVAAYWVPGDTGLDRFLSMAKGGVKIKVLTNSLEAADGPYVYSGYAKRRKPLLEAGIKLYEMKRLSPTAPKQEKTKEPVLWAVRVPACTRKRFRWCRRQCAFPLRAASAERADEETGLALKVSSRSAVGRRGTSRILMAQANGEKV